MKRFVSAVMAVLLAFIQLFALYGCSSKAKNPITVGEWLKLVNSSFGIQQEENNTPYFSDISSSDTYYADVQSAASWGIVTRDMDFRTNDNLTWSMMISTLLNAGNFVSEIADEETRANYFRTNFDPTYKDKTGKKDVESDKAVEFLNAAVQKWASLKYDESYSYVEYSEGTIDFTAESNKDIKYVPSHETNTVSFTKKELDDAGIAICEGDVFILPADETLHTDTAYVAKEVVADDTGKIVYVTYSNDGIAPETLIQEMNVQETVSATESNYIISLPDGTENNGNMSNVAYSNNSGAPRSSFLDVKTTLGNTIEFDYDGFKICFGGEVDQNGNVKFSGKVEADDLIESESASLKSSVNFEISDLSISHKEEISWFDVKYLRLSADYKTKVEFSIDSSYKEGLFARKGYDTIGQTFFSEISSEPLKDLKPFSGYSNDRIKIACITLFGAGTVAGVTLDVSLVIKIDGSLDVVIEESGTKGIEYKGGKLRSISNTTKEKDVNLNVKAECTINCGPNVYGLGCKLVGIEISFGIGANASLKANLADEENHLLVEQNFNDPNSKITPDFLEYMRVEKFTATPDAIELVAFEKGYNYRIESTESIDLKIDVCIDVSIYFILRIGISTDSLISKLLKTKLSIELLGKNNATFHNIHIDNFDLKTAQIHSGSGASEDYCTLKYKEFENKQGETIAPDEDGTYIYTDYFTITPSLTVQIGESKKIEVLTLISGYTMSDIVFKSDKSGIATVSPDGTVTGERAGVAQITASTRDGKYSATCKIVVA